MAGNGFLILFYNNCSGVRLVSIKGKTLASALKESEFKELGFSAEKDFEIQKIKSGIWIVTESEQQKPAARTDETEQKILGLLKKKELKEKVEGVFEKFLNKQELEKFSQMLAQGKIIRFKLNQKYKKAIYKSAEEQQPKKKAETKELTDRQNIEEYNLQKNGFLVLRNEERIKRANEELAERFKKGELRGIKCFDGNCYVIETNLLEMLKEKALAAFKKQKKLTAEELAKQLGTGITPAKIAAEFLKEEGALFEKRKEQYYLIE